MTQQSLEKMMSIKLPAEDCHLLLAQVLVNTGKGVDSCLPLVCVCVCVCVAGCQRMASVGGFDNAE